MRKSVFRGFQYLGWAIIAMVFQAAPAAAQFASNSNAPVQLFADSIESEQNIISLDGQVDVRQGDVRVLSDNMKIYGGAGASFDSGSLDEVERIIAKGNFYYITPEQEVRGAQGIYEQVSDTFTVTGNVILLQGENNIVTGEKLIYTLSTNKARMVGSCKGRKCGTKGRVKALLKNSEQGDSSPET